MFEYRMSTSIEKKETYEIRMVTKLPDTLVTVFVILSIVFFRMNNVSNCNDFLIIINKVTIYIQSIPMGTMHYMFSFITNASTYFKGLTSRLE